MREVRIFYHIESHEMTKNDIEDTLAASQNQAGNKNLN